MRTARIMAAVAVAATGLAASSALGGIVVFEEDFTGNPANPFTTGHNGDMTFTVANEAYRIYNTVNAIRQGYALVNKNWTEAGDFSISADVDVVKSRFTGNAANPGFAGLYAYTGATVTPNKGYGVRVRNAGEPANSTTWLLEIMNGTTVLKASSAFDLTSGTTETDYLLSLSGDFAGTGTAGDLTLTATLTPKAGSNPNNLGIQTINTTVLAANLDLTPTYWGMRVSGMNTPDYIFDNVQISVIPEPATLGLVAALGGGLLFIRRFFRL